MFHGIWKEGPNAAAKKTTAIEGSPTLRLRACRPIKPAPIATISRGAHSLSILAGEELAVLNIPDQDCLLRPQWNHVGNPS